MTYRQIAHMTDLNGARRRFTIDGLHLLTRKTGMCEGWDTRDYLTVNGQSLSVISAGDKTWLVAYLACRESRHALHWFCREVQP